MNEGDNLDELIRRWQRAAERALEERVRVVDINGELHATSSSRPLGAYRLAKTDEGWACECRANDEFRLPCKHLSALADHLNLDVLQDMRVQWPPITERVPQEVV